MPLQGLGDVADITAIEPGFDGCVSSEVALGLERDAIRLINRTSTLSRHGEHRVAQMRDRQCGPIVKYGANL